MCFGDFNVHVGRNIVGFRGEYGVGQRNLEGRRQLHTLELWLGLGNDMLPVKHCRSNEAFFHISLIFWGSRR